MYYIATFIGFMAGFFLAASFSNKTKREQELEDQEQIQYLAEYRKKQEDKNEW